MREIKVKIEALTDLAVGDVVEMRTDKDSHVDCRRKVLTPPLGLVIGLSWRIRDMYDTQKALFVTLGYIKACNGMKITTTDEPEYITAEEAKRKCMAGQIVKQVFESGDEAMLYYCDGILIERSKGYSVVSKVGFVETFKYYLV